MTSSRVSEDQELIRSLAAGDLGAMRCLYERHAPWLSVRLTRRCNDPEVVADVLQDAFVAVWRGADRYRGDGDVAAWLWGIAIRRLVSRLRARRDVLVLRELPESREVLMSVEDELLRHVEYGDLGRAIAQLSPEMRSVLQATVLDGLTVREAARLLGIPQNTVRTRLQRAKARLRANLEEGGLT